MHNFVKRMGFMICELYLKKAFIKKKIRKTGYFAAGRVKWREAWKQRVQFNRFGRPSKGMMMKTITAIISC